MYVYNTPVGKCRITFSQNKGKGTTKVEVVQLINIEGYDESKDAWVGEAHCSLREPSGFVPLKGKKTALAHAMELAGWGKAERTQVWQELDARGWLRGDRQFREL